VSIELPPSWVTKATLSPKFRSYYTIVSKGVNSADLDKIAQDCVKEIESLFSVSIAIPVKVYYDQDLYNRASKKVQTPRDIISYIDDEYSIYIKPQRGVDKEVLVLSILEGIIKMLVVYLIPDTNQVTKEYYTALLIYQKVLRVNISEEEIDGFKVKLEKQFGENISEIPKVKKDTLLPCPFCREVALEFLGLQNVGAFELQGGIPIITGKNTNIQLMAYYKCTNCSRIFYTTPQKMD